MLVCPACFCIAVWLGRKIFRLFGWYSGIALALVPFGCPSDPHPVLGAGGGGGGHDASYSSSVVGLGGSGGGGAGAYLSGSGITLPATTYPVVIGGGGGLVAPDPDAGYHGTVSTCNGRHAGGGWGGNDVQTT